MRRFVAAAHFAVVTLAACSSFAFIWPNVPDEIARSLAAEDVGERRAAAAKLRDLPAAVAAPMVTAALGDPDTEVRLIAARAAVEQRVAGSGDRVVPWLSETDMRLRLMACELIRIVPAPSALAQLTRVLGDASPAVRVASATTLGALGIRDSVPSLLGHLDDPSPEVRTAIVQALGRIGDGRAVVPLLGKVQDGNADVRRIAVRVLGDLGDARAASALMLALQDKQIYVQVEAIDSLGRLGAADATSALSPIAQDRNNPRLRSAAVMALGRIATPGALDALMATLGSDDATAEQSPVRDALVKAGSAAVPRLTAAVTASSSTDTAAAACLVLGELGDRKNTQLIIDAMQRGRVPAHVALRSLGRMADPTAIPVILELLDSPSLPVRKAAMQAATALLDPGQPDGRSVDPLAAQLMNVRTSVDERVALAKLLGRTGSPRSAPMLIALTTTKDDRLRLAAIDALGSVSGAARDKVLIDALSDEEASVRLAAAMSLARGSGPAVAGQLATRLSVASEQDRLAVGVALAGAMATSNDAVVPTVAKMMSTVREPLRDVLIEGLGRLPGAAASRQLEQVSTSVFADDRRKVAEAIAGHPEAIGVARKLAQDADPSVQANAAWTLGVIGEASDEALLMSLASHRDVAVAGNAVVALGRVGLRTKHARTEVLCKALDDNRSYVRANAIAALRLTGSRCGTGDKERTLLTSDLMAIVRERAAGLIRRVPSPEPAADARALRRCLFDDRSGSVATECRDAAIERPKAAGSAEPVTVFVVPDGASGPTPRAPFALVLADGTMRLGLADRRGGVFEHRAPKGEVALAVPATQVR